MKPDEFSSVMPYISSDLVKMIIQKKNIPAKDAIKALYSSKLYAALEQEETKVWQYSTLTLYALLEMERETGALQFPDV